MKIGSGEGGFDGRLREGDRFGAAIAEIADLDGDGLREIAVGAPGDDDAGEDAGAVWVLFVDRDERVRAAKKLTPLSAGLPAAAVPSHAFGHAVCSVPEYGGGSEIAVAVSLVPAVEGDPAAEVWFLRLDPSAAVTNRRLLDWSFLSPYHRDGPKTSALRLAVPPGPLAGKPALLSIGLPLEPEGAQHDDAGWIHHCLLDVDGRLSESFSASPLHIGEIGDTCLEYGRAILLADVSSEGAQLEPLYGFVADGRGGVFRHGASPNRLTFPATEDPDDPGFGTSIAWLDDRDGDGAFELAIGLRDNHEGTELSPGGIWIVSVERRRLRVQSWELVLPGFRGLPFRASPGDRFGESLATLTDRDGDQRVDLAIGAPGDDAGAADAGAIWLYGPGDGGEH